MSSTNRGSVKDPYQFYPTPGWATKLLYKYSDMPVPTFDPCAGEGDIIIAVHDCIQGSEMVGAELHEERVVACRAKGLLVRQADARDISWHGEDVCMNPPFSGDFGGALEFVEKGMQEAGSMACFLRINFLGAVSRHDWWAAGRQPDEMWILSSRPFKDSIEYAWFCWHNPRVLDPERETKIGWLVRPKAIERWRERTGSRDPVEI
jgi:hypothetical protein